MNEVRIVPTHLALQQIHPFFIRTRLKVQGSSVLEPRIRLRKYNSPTSIALRLNLIVMGRSCKMRVYAECCSHIGLTQSCSS